MPIHPPTATRRRLDRVLLVARRPSLVSALGSCGQPHRPASVIHCDTLAAARDYLATHRVDAALIEPDLTDGSGLDLVRDVAELPGTTAAILVVDDADFDLARQAMRARADDVLVMPIRPTALSRSVLDAVERRRRSTVHGERVERLHRLCRKLNDARLDVSRQVDTLCSDLVNAYKELAEQVHQPPPGDGGFAESVGDELDLETLLRLTLEYLMDRAGPCNAAIYLPATMDEYSLGGYVNLDIPDGAADLLLSSLADTFAPRIAEAAEAVHVTSRAEMERWAGRDAEDLDGRHVVAVSCDGDDECLAVVVLFRDGETPFEASGLDAVAAMAPLLGTALERIIRVHHRVSLHDDANPFDADDLDLGYEGEELPF